MAGMLVDRPGTPCVGGGEVKVVSVETRGQLDAGWLAAIIQCKLQLSLESNYCIYTGPRDLCTRTGIVLNEPASRSKRPRPYCPW